MLLGATILQDEGARVVGKMNTDVPGMFTFIVPGRIQIPNLGEWSPAQPGNLRLPKFDVAAQSFLGRSLAVAALVPVGGDRCVGSSLPTQEF